MDPCEASEHNEIIIPVFPLSEQEPTTSLSPAATTTQTTTMTSLAQTKTLALTTSTSSNVPRSSSSLPTSFSPIIATTLSVLAQTMTPVATIPSPPATMFHIAAQTANPVAAVSSALAKTPLPPPPSHVDTAVIAAGTVGAVIGAIIALIPLMLVLKWRKRRAKEDSRVTKHGNEERMLVTDANGAGSHYGSGRSRDPFHVMLISIKLSQQGTSKRYLGDYVTLSLSLTRYQALLVLSPAVTCSEPCRQANVFAYRFRSRMQRRRQYYSIVPRDEQCR